METKENFQNTLISTESEEFKQDYMYICSKKVNSDSILSEDDFSASKKEEIFEVLNTMYVSGDYSDFDNFKFNSNCKDLIISLLSDPEDVFRELKFLMNDFSNNMNTNMREKGMYVISILTPDKLILIHSKMGEKTITPDLEVFQRMIDKNNVKRYVSFEKKDKIKVRYYEVHKSKFFIEWLGISKKEAIYKFGGENKFYCEINGITATLEISDEYYDKLKDDENYEITNNSIKLPYALQELNLTHIMRGNRRINTINEFNREHKARKFELYHYQDQYKKLSNSLDPFSSKIYDTESKVYDIHKTHVKKENSNVEILFCNSEIEIAEEYVEKLKVDMLNNHETHITHAGMEFEESPLEIRNLKIYNKLNVKLAMPLINYLKEDELSESFKKQLIYVILEMLAENNSKKPISEFFRNLKNAIRSNLEFSSNIYEDKVIELKARDFVSGKDKRFIDKLAEDIGKK